MRIIGLAGWSGSGKTTLLTKVIPRLVARGLKVSRSSTPITPSTSTSRARIRTAIAWPARPRSWSARPTAGRWCTSCAARRSPPSTALLRKLSPVDLVLVEGYKREPHPKLEVYRAAIGKPLLHPDDPAIVAVASDEPLPAARIPVVDLDDIERIADILLRHAAPLDAMPAHAGGR